MLILKETVEFSKQMQFVSKKCLILENKIMKNQLKSKTLGRRKSENQIVA